MTRETAFVASYALLVGMKIICFIIGYQIVKLGHELLKSGVKGEFSFSAEWSKWKLNLASVTPGLLFVLLGAWIIGFAMYVKKEIKFDEAVNERPYIENLESPDLRPYDMDSEGGKNDENIEN